MVTTAWKPRPACSRDFAGPGLTIYQNHNVVDVQAGGLKPVDGLELAIAGGSEVVDEHDGLAGLVLTLDRGAGAVVLGLLARVDHGKSALQ